MKSGEVKEAKAAMKELAEDCIDTGVQDLVELGQQILSAMQLTDMDGMEDVIQSEIICINSGDLVA